MDQKQKNVISLVTIAVLVIGSWAIVLPPQEKITQGLDIQGGVSVILTAQETTSTKVTAAVMDRAELIVNNRVNKLGASEASIQKQGNDSILVQLPGVKNAAEALKVLGSTGQLEFVDVETITDSATVAAIQSGDENVELKPGTYTPVMTGEVVTNSSVGTDSTTNKIVVNVTMNNKGRQAWGDYTTSHVGKQVAIVLDGKVQSAPTVQEPITDGRTQISGNFTPTDAKNLKTVLETGALPVTLVFSESRTVGPTLGQDSLRQGVLAALAGLALVMLYMALFYRGLGVISWFSLLIFSSIFLGVLALLSTFGWFALSLPGVAGIVLTIGMAADSTILQLERFKEEIGMGKTLRSAAKSGTMHAFWTSVDADLVTFVSALVLFLVAVGPIKGFALTLMIGIACDLTVAFLFTRTAIMLFAESGLTKVPWLFGLKGGASHA